MKEYLDFKTTHFFPIASRYLGYLIIVIGIIGVFTRGIETLIISFVGIGLSFTRFGVLIDLENQKLKEYTNIFGLKTGKWKSMVDYPDLTVLEISEKSAIRSNANIEFSSREMVFKITLLNENHYEKILLKQLKNREEAHQEAQKIASDLSVEKVIYNPGNR